MKRWKSREDADRYHRTEGFLVGEVECIDCGYRHDGYVFPTTNLRTLECNRCGARWSRFIERKP